MNGETMVTKKTDTQQKTFTRLSKIIVLNWKKINVVLKRLTTAKIPQMNWDSLPCSEIGKHESKPHSYFDSKQLGAQYEKELTYQ